MTRNLIVAITALICINTSSFGQNKSNAEKMGYARTTQYWGPGTYYCYAPGKPINKMANNAETAMRDLTGIWEEDFYKEIAKQGFVKVPKKEIKKWFNDNNSKTKKFYYSPDKSYILFPSIKNLDNSPAMANGHGAPVSTNMMRYVLIPKEDSLKVMDAIWQFLRDLNEMKAALMSLGSKYKNSKSGVYPCEQAEATGWSNFRAGTWVQKMVDGKQKNYWERHEKIIRRTIGKPKFDLWILGQEIDYCYGMHVTLQKEGYVLYYALVSSTLGDLEPGNTWIKEHPMLVEQYNNAIRIDKHDIDQYKGKLPPNIEDLNLLLHIK